MYCFWFIKGNGEGTQAGIELEVEEMPGFENIKKTVNLSIYSLLRAIDGVRTRDPDLGKVVLYQEQYILYYRISYLSTTFLKKINFFEISNCMFKSYCLHQSLPVYYNIQKENYSHRLFCYDVLKSKRIILQSKRWEWNRDQKG